MDDLQAFPVYTFDSERFKKLEESVFNSREGGKIDSEE